MITIVIASYHYGHLAAHCIESILAQSQSPAKIMFVDDGAGDCEHLPKLYPDIEYVLRKENLGTVENFQDMLERVKTEYVMFIGADNWLRADTVQLLSTAKTDIVTYDIVVTGELKDEILIRVPGQTRRYQGDYYWNRKQLHHGSMLYRTSLGKKVGYKKKDKNGKHPQEDWNLWDKMLEMGASVSSIEEGLLYYRRHRENYLKYGVEELIKEQNKKLYNSITIKDLSNIT